MNRLLSSIGLLWVTTLASFGLPANLISNHSFENGMTDWRFVHSAGIHIVDALDPTHTGDYMAYINAYPGYGEISQTVATIPGHTYDVEYWLSSNGGTGYLYSV